MGLDKLIKREIGITIATVLLVTTVFIMFSYSIFKVEVSGETNAITFGDVSLSFCADSSCNSTLSNIGNVIGTKTENGITSYVPIYPQADPTTSAEWENLSPYLFTLTNNGTLDLYITIFLTRDPNPDFKYSTNGTIPTDPVPDNQVKIGIGELGATPTIKLYSDTKNANGEYIIASNIKIPAGNSKNFNLYAWLKSDAENASQGKYFVTQISARGEYLPSDVNINQ